MRGGSEPRTGRSTPGQHATEHAWAWLAVPLPVAHAVARRRACGMHALCAVSYVLCC